MPAFNLSFINIDIDFEENNNSYIDVTFLFYFIKYIIEFLHEPLGHNFKIFESYNEKLETPFKTPRNKDKVQEGGFLMEILLINSVGELNIEHVLFLLNENNWKFDHKTFLEKFKSIKAPILENCINHIQKSNLMKHLLNIFAINKNSISYAIDNTLILSTKINDIFQNELIIQSDEKYRKTNENKNKNKGRICRTHLSN